MLGGTPLNVRQTPYYALLVWNKITPWCGGSILSKKHILTAAHCLDKNLGDLYVGVGYETGFHASEFVPVYTAHVHPGYKDLPSGDRGNVSYNSLFEYDVVMLTLKRNILCSSKTRPVRLPKIGSSLPKTLSPMLAVGYNINTTTRLRLTFTYAPMVDYKRCSEIYGKNRIDLGNSVFCAGQEGNGTDVIWMGDSGGPLVFNDILYGVVSYGLSSEPPLKPVVFVNVLHILKWINHFVLARPLQSTAFQMWINYWTVCLFVANKLLL